MPPRLRRPADHIAGDAIETSVPYGEPPYGYPSHSRWSPLSIAAAATTSVKRVSRGVVPGAKRLGMVGLARPAQARPTQAAGRRAAGEAGWATEVAAD